MLWNCVIHEEKISAGGRFTPKGPCSVSFTFAFHIDMKANLWFLVSISVQGLVSFCLSFADNLISGSVANKKKKRMFLKTECTFCSFFIELNELSLACSDVSDLSIVCHHQVTWCHGPCTICSASVLSVTGSVRHDMPASSKSPGLRTPSTLSTTSCDALRWSPWRTPTWIRPGWPWAKKGEPHYYSPPINPVSNSHNGC